MKKISIKGKKYIHLFRRISDGKLIEQEITPGEYAILGLKNASPATMDGCVWLFSEERPYYDTPTGDLGDNQYAELNGKYLVKKPGRVTATFDTEDVIDGELTQAAILKLEKKVGIEPTKEKIWL